MVHNDSRHGEMLAGISKVGEAPPMAANDSDGPKSLNGPNH